MQTSGDPSPLLLDTSTAIALVIGDHDHHDSVFDALTGRELGLAGHAVFETFSVLTRLPTPSRLSSDTALDVIEANFPHTRFLSANASAQVLAQAVANGVAGGAIYDALVGAVAVEHGLTLVSRDRRAVATYRALEATIKILP